jgi:TIR domain
MTPEVISGVEEPPSHDVFLSYATADRFVATAVCAGVEETGAHCWMAPRDILPGRDWAEAIVEAITAATAMVLIFSSSSNASGQVLREVERAVSKQIPLVPFRIENITPTNAMEYFLGASQWLDAFDPPLDMHVRRVADAVAAILTGRTEASESVASPPLSTVGGLQPLDFDVARLAPDDWANSGGRFGTLVRRLLADR